MEHGSPKRGMRAPQDQRKGAQKERRDEEAGELKDGKSIGAMQDGESKTRQSEQSNRSDAGMRLENAVERAMQSE